jgi:hypothetical protein
MPGQSADRPGTNSTHVPAAVRDLTRLGAGHRGGMQLSQEMTRRFQERIREHPEDWHMLQKLFLADLAPQPPGAGPEGGCGGDTVKRGTQAQGSGCPG